MLALPFSLFQQLGSFVCMCQARVWKRFPSGSGGKEPTRNPGDLGSIPGLGRSPEKGHGNPFQYSCLESPSGQRSLAGYSPWGRKELDTTEWLSTKDENSSISNKSNTLTQYVVYWTVTFRFKSFPDGSTGKESSFNAGDIGNVDLIPGSGRSPGEEMATHSIILAWEIP